MKRAALFLVLAYVVLFIMLTWPVLLASFYDPGKNFPNFSDVISCFKVPAYWMFLIVISICQAGLLFIPVKIENRRPTSRRSVYFPVIVSGFLTGSLVLGIICSLNEFFQREAAFGKDWEGWLAIAFCIIIWMVWSFIFCRLASGDEPQNIVLRQCRFLLCGSVISLLVAVPTHIVARHRGYCCAGFYTFVGIAFGIAVLLLSFGPSVYFLYAERWRKLHPDETLKGKEAEVGK